MNGSLKNKNLGGRFLFYLDPVSNYTAHTILAIPMRIVCSTANSITTTGY